MKAGELNDWLGVITNVGVIAGLALVAYEIQQNSVAIDREARSAQVEVLDGVRSAWQNWEYAIIENRDVAELWMRGNAGEELEPVEQLRYERLVSENYRLIRQNYRQFSTMTGEPVDWAIHQFIDRALEFPGTGKIFVRLLERQPADDPFRQRVMELAPPQLSISNLND